jgi:putative FmdB family regulatory protein
MFFKKKEKLMPVYDYRCTECNSLYDVYHKGREIKEDVICPSCGSTHHKKMMSVPIVTMGSTSSSSDFSANPNCESGGCCGGGACSLN